MKKILVIEDNFEVRENLVEILELDSYEVYSAENGKIGIQKAHECNPDLILCDVMMPELDGFGVLKILNRSPDLNNIPFIFLTAKSEKADFRKGMGLGAEDFITKPFDDVELLNSIEMRIQKSERLRNINLKTPQGLQHLFSEAKGNGELIKISLDREVRKFKSDDLVFEIGKSARWLYFVQSGQVKLFVINDNGKELTTQLISEGEFFGYFSIIGNSKYQNSAKCTADTELRLIPEKDFLNVLFNNRDFAAKFIKLLSKKTINLESKLLDLAYSSVRKKVANSLVEYSLVSNQVSDKAYEIYLSRSELAAMAGISKETAIRALSEFKSEKLIQIIDKKIIIPDIKLLSELIG